MDLPAELAELYHQRREAIRTRLADFAVVPQEAWFYELCYCILTPQSRAVHADWVVHQLIETRFYETGDDVLHLLRNKDTYIRFHNVKHRRLHAIRAAWPELELVIADAARLQQLAHVSVGSNAMGSNANEAVRKDLVDRVGGIGMKEASHFLRNIGFRGLAILDRHLLTNLVRCKVYFEIPRVASVPQYLAVEAEFKRLAEMVSIDMDELDLLFWSAQTGVILK